MTDTSMLNRKNSFVPNASLIPAANDDNTVYFDLNGKQLNFPKDKDDQTFTTFAGAYGKRFSYLDEKFADPAQIRPLNALGHTRKKNVFHGYKGGWYTRYTNDAGFIVAPQFYKSASDYANFPKRPRESQLLLAGNGIFPVPQAPRRALPHEQKGIEYLTSSVFVRGLHVDPMELKAEVEEKYWSKASKIDRPVEGYSTFLKRMASSFIGGKFDKDAIWLPKGEFFNDNTRLQDGEEAADYWDANINPTFMKSN